MPPRIAIISLSDSFSDSWSQLARLAGAKLEVEGAVDEVRSIHAAAGVMIAAGGVEAEAKVHLRELREAGVSDAVVSGSETEYRLIAELLLSGARNYFALPYDLGLCRNWFLDRVERAIDRRKLERFDEREHFDFTQLIGNSRQLREALQRTARVIPRGNTTVLITGETGTGKELLARAIHYNGLRAARPFVEINCTTLPEQLLEAELFGYEPGAFTDARMVKPGLFEVANGGTLFLDEIGDLSPGLQAKLLRVLEQKRIRRLGSVRDIEVDVRVIAATHVDLPEAIVQKRFRKDLYYRLNVVPIHLPALRERGDDVLVLAEHFLLRFSQQHQITLPSLSTEVKRAMRNYTWPGNVRELRNSIERAVLLGDGHFYAEDLFPDRPSQARTGETLPFPATMQAIEEAAAQAMVARCNGNKSEAAKLLGISRKHLYSLLGRAERG